MAALGLFLIWSGYTFGVYGFSKIKSAYGASPSLALADVALPKIFERLRGLRLDMSEPVRIGGWAFRGLLNLPVIWELA